MERMPGATTVGGMDLNYAVVPLVDDSDNTDPEHGWEAFLAVVHDTGQTEIQNAGNTVYFNETHGTNFPLFHGVVFRREESSRPVGPLIQLPQPPVPANAPVPPLLLDVPSGQDPEDIPLGVLFNMWNDL